MWFFGGFIISGIHSVSWIYRFMSFAEFGKYYFFKYSFSPLASVFLGLQWYKFWNFCYCTAGPEAMYFLCVVLITKFMVQSSNLLSTFSNWMLPEGFFFSLIVFFNSITFICFFITCILFLCWDYLFLFFFPFSFPKRIGNCLLMCLYDGYFKILVRHCGKQCGGFPKN